MIIIANAAKMRSIPASVHTLSSLIICIKDNGKPEVLKSLSGEFPTREPSHDEILEMVSHTLLTTAN
jgi:hypothetical protein